MPVDDASEGLCAPAASLARLARDELGEMSTRQRAEGFLRLNARVGGKNLVRRRRVFKFAFAAALSLAAAAAFGWHRFGTEPVRALSYSVEGGGIGSSGTLVATGTEEPTLRFSDGTEVTFRAGASGQLKSVSEHGARIALRGKVDVEVVHWRGAHWLFDAGPFLVTVRGTAFTADWQEAEQRLEIALRTGAIAVSGPLSDEAISLRAGQRLVISVRDKEVVIRDIDAPSEPKLPASATVRDEAPASEVPAEPTDALPARTASAAPPAALNWSGQLAAGNFAAILRDAERRGIEATISEVSSADLAALADAARYSRRDDVARRALTAQRRRFPRSARANDAAFLLGRLEEAAQRPELALGWYQRCLEESPHGTYVAEALGRKMTVVQRVHGQARAVPIAREYLQRFASGTYAAAARALVQAP